jgi:hypothetical protein
MVSRKSGRGSEGRQQRKIYYGGVPAGIVRSASATPVAPVSNAVSKGNNAASDAIIEAAKKAGSEAGALAGEAVAIQMLSKNKNISKSGTFTNMELNVLKSYGMDKDGILGNIPYITKIAFLKQLKSGCTTNSGATSIVDAKCWPVIAVVREIMDKAIEKEKTGTSESITPKTQKKNDVNPNQNTITRKIQRHTTVAGTLGNRGKPAKAVPSSGTAPRPSTPRSSQPSQGSYTAARPGSVLNKTRRNAAGLPPAEKQTFSGPASVLQEIKVPSRRALYPTESSGKAPRPETSTRSGSVARPLRNATNPISPEKRAAIEQASTTQSNPLSKIQNDLFSYTTPNTGAGTGLGQLGGKRRKTRRNRH